MPWITNISESHAVALCPKENPAPFAMVSITDSERQRVGLQPTKLAFNISDLIRLVFDDADKYNSAHPTVELFTPKQAEILADWLEKHRGKDIVCHCAAGLSRSGGVVEAVLRAWPEYRDLGARRYPNGLVVRLLLRAMGIVPIGAEEEK